MGGTYLGVSMHVWGYLAVCGFSRFRELRFALGAFGLGFGWMRWLGQKKTSGVGCREKSRGNGLGFRV